MKRIVSFGILICFHIIDIPLRLVVIQKKIYIFDGVFLFFGLMPVYCGNKNANSIVSSISAHYQLYGSPDRSQTAQRQRRRERINCNVPFSHQVGTRSLMDKWLMDCFNSQIHQLIKTIKRTITTELTFESTIRIWEWKKKNINKCYFHDSIFNSCAR